MKILSISILTCFLLFSFLVILANPTTLCAEIETNPGGIQSDPFTIVNGNNFVDVDVSETSTLGITGGTISQRLRLKEESTSNISGGIVTRLETSGSSFTKITNGMIGIAHLLDNSKIQVSGGVHGPFSTHDNGKFEVTGGEFSAILVEDEGTLNLHNGIVNDELFADLNGTVNIFGGAVDEIIAGLNDDGDENEFVINIYGGDIAHINYFRFGKINLFGGTIDTMLIRTPGVSIYGTGLTIQELEAPRWLLTGTLADGTDANIEITTLPSFINLVEIPEPDTLLVVLFGGIVLLKRIRVTNDG